MDQRRPSAWIAIACVVKSDPNIRTMRKALAIYSCWISSCQDPFMKAQTACHWCVSKLGSPVNCDITEVYVQF